MSKILVTGGAGFIGSNFIHYWLRNHPDDQVINLDKLTYAGHKESLKDVENNPNYKFIKGDVASEEDVETVMRGVDTVVHFAAESHNDRANVDPLNTFKANALGTAVLLTQALKNKIKRFHHISTDEVYGHLKLGDPPFKPDSPYRPRGPYPASKASSDHMARAFFTTFNLPVTITNCANNYGPFHDPEKLIPRFITNLLEDKKVPLMGKGENVREWLYVDDHARAIELVLEKGKLGETYLVEGEEITNIDVTKKLLRILGKDESFIEFVPDRLAHDFRYANDGSKLRELGWEREHNFEEWLQKTVEWFKANEWWWKPLKGEEPNIDPKAQQKLKV